MYLEFMNWVRHGSSTTFETGLIELKKKKNSKLQNKAKEVKLV